MFYIDSSFLESCHIKREHQHKTLKKISAKGKTSTGFHYGVKVHLMANQLKQIVDFKMTPGNVADNNEFVILDITKNISGKVYGDRGYILNSNLKAMLELKNVKIISRGRKNMKNNKLSQQDEDILKNRWSIESVFNILKSELGLEHTLHRSIAGFITHIISCLLSYFYYSEKTFYKKII